MQSKPFSRLLVIALSVIAFLVLAACSAAQTPTASEPLPTATTPPQITPTTTAVPDAVWLVAGADIDPRTQSEFSAWLSEQAVQAGMEFSVVDAFPQSETPANLKYVVVLSPVENISALAANGNQTQFVVITNQSQTPSTNLSVIHAADDQAAFLAGYLAILNAPDFRSGALLIDGAAQTPRLQETFVNGGRYFCGRCAPVYAPIVIFPQIGLVPANADAAAWQAAFDTLNKNNLEMLYLPPEGLLPDFLTYLSTKNIKVVSSAPPPDGSEGLWVASVHSDALAALQEIWPDIQAGSGGQEVSAKLVIDHVNSANLSPGRLQRAERLIPDLLSGIISPLSVP